jgi:branched-chain amino acid transport system substrate-binding protein
LILREYARRRPETAFLIQPSAAPELTLTDGAPNVFRFAADSSQWVAGAGTYAYRDLGWRTAVIVGDDAPFSWQQAAGFVAEFCALCGRIVDRTWITMGTDPAALVPKVTNSADGVFLAPTFSPMLDLLKGYAASHADVSRRLVSSAVLLYDPTVLPVATGVVAAGPLPFAPTPAITAYVRAFTRAFPTIPATAAIGPITVPYRDGVEALLGALEQARGETGKSLLDELARTRLDSASGQIRLDRNRQAVGPTYLSRVVTDSKRNRRIETLRVVSNVEQTFGGYFKPGDPPPSRTSPACRKANPPAWAR